MLLTLGSFSYVGNSTTMVSGLIYRCNRMWFSLLHPHSHETRLHALVITVPEATSNASSLPGAYVSDADLQYPAARKKRKYSPRLTACYMELLTLII